ncbi:hypothetical protein [Paracraurococcus ruber]|nr:hypothetical protein [Paracraurococcus ruber]
MTRLAADRHDLSMVASSSFPSRQRFWAKLLALAPLFGIGTYFAADLMVPALDDPRNVPPSIVERRQICDRVVDALLNTRDLIELQRSGILVRQLECDVARRMPREPLAIRQ